MPFTPETYESLSLLLKGNEDLLKAVSKIFEAYPYTGQDIAQYVKSFGVAFRKKLRDDHNFYTSPNSKLYKDFVNGLIKHLQSNPPAIVDVPKVSDTRPKETFIEMNRRMYAEIGLPWELQNNQSIVCLPEKMEAIPACKDFYISRGVPSGDFGFYLHKTGRTISTTLSNKEGDMHDEKKTEEFPFTCARVVLPLIPDSVQKIHVPDSDKKKGAYYQIKVGGETELVSHEDLTEGKWTDKYSSHLGGMSSRENSLLAHVCAYLAEIHPVIQGKNSTGLHEIGGIWGFLDKADNFHTNRDVQEKPIFTGDKVGPTTKKAYESYFKRASKPFDLEKVCSSIEYLKGLSDRGTSLILLSHFVSSKFSKIRSSNFMHGHAALLYAESGQGKTTDSCLAARVCKPTLYTGALEGTCRDTKGSMEVYVHVNSDTAVILDDAEPSASLTEQAINSFIENAAKCSYDKGPIRKRRQQDMSAKNDHYCNSNPLFTSTAFPTGLSTGSYRRTLFINLKNGELRLKSTQEGNNLEDAYIKHSHGIEMLGYQIDELYLSHLNSGEGTPDERLERYADARLPIWKNYQRELGAFVRKLWSEYTDTKLPENADNIIDIGATLLLAAYDIDEVTTGRCKLAEYLLPRIASTILQQLQYMAGSRVGEKGIGTIAVLLEEFLTRMVSGVKFKDAYCKMHSLAKNDTPNDIKLNEVLIPETMFKNRMDDSKSPSHVAIYLDYDPKKPLEGIAWISQNGKNALLLLCKELEDCQHIKSMRELERLFIQEGIKDKSIQETRFHPYGEGRQRGIPVKMSLLLSLLIDNTEAFKQPSKPVQEVKEATTTTTGIDFAKLMAVSEGKKLEIENKTARTVSTQENTPKVSGTTKSKSKSKKG